jgi:hypothetical protein
MITSLSQQNLELLLNRSNAVVVFFLVLLNDPDIMRKIYRKGHTNTGRYHALRLLGVL